MNLKKTLALPFRIAPVSMTLSIMYDIINLAIAPINVLITAYFINTAILVATEGYNPRAIILPLVLMGAFSVYTYIGQPLIRLLDKDLLIKFRQKIRPQMLKKHAGLEFKHFENRKTADLLNRVWQDPEGQLIKITSNLQGFILTVARLASYAVILIIHAPLAGVILITLSIPVFIINGKAGKASYNARREVSLDTRYSWYTAWVLQSRETAAERNMFGFSDYLSKKYEHHFEANRKHMLKVNARWILRSVSSSVMLGILSAVGLFSIIGGLSIGLFIALQGALFTSVQWIGWNLSNFFKEFTSLQEFLKDFNQFMNLSEIPEANAFPKTPSPKFEKLEFKNVSFAYPDTEKQVLNNLSLVMESGKHYSFVGANGAGKTTITKLLTCLYNNYTGEILLNGKDLKSYPLSEIKAYFCALFQDFSRYDITVAENTAIGKINGANEAEIENALSLSGFNEIEKDTLLGKTHSGSIDLSGGQWQRLAFSRAIISPAPIKILDEPTAALDPIAEAKIQFETISNNATLIFISHRLASAKTSDKIFVLENGTVAEEGSHEQLIQKNGLYAEMFESQRSWYTP